MKPIIKALEEVYGKESNAGFGSSVFQKTVKPDAVLASIALEDYKYFMGEKWKPETEATWLIGWKNVFERKQGVKSDILTELDNITDDDAKRSVPLLTELIENAEQGKMALAAAYNHPDISGVAVFTVGDNAALSGLILTGIFTDNTACSVICLMD